MLAKNAQAPRQTRLPASSLTIFASKLAPTELDCPPRPPRRPWISRQGNTELANLNPSFRGAGQCLRPVPG
ncbi:hypothetical protein DK871_26005 [Pseudomonas sp. L13]|nr:hypothetical protein [Pseudomonas sp. L13]